MKIFLCKALLYGIPLPQAHRTEIQYNSSDRGFIFCKAMSILQPWHCWCGLYKRTTSKMYTVLWPSWGCTQGSANMSLSSAPLRTLGQSSASSSPDLTPAGTLRKFWLWHCSEEKHSASIINHCCPLSHHPSPTNLPGPTGNAVFQPLLP